MGYHVPPLLILSLATLSIAFEPPTRGLVPNKAPLEHPRPPPLDQIIIQSHRGAGVLAEEGTLEAFELGWKLGIWPEADLRATRDGVIVSFHDTTFARVLKDPPGDLQKKGVEDLVYAEVAQLDVGERKGEAFKGRRVLAMAQVFEIMREDRRKAST